MDSFACNGQTVDSVSEQRAHRTILWRQSLERQKTCTPSNLGCQLTVSSVKAYMASPVNPVGTKHLRANQRNSPTGNSTNQRANLHQIKWNFATTLRKAQEISAKKICLKSSRIEGEFHKIGQNTRKARTPTKPWYQTIMHSQICTQNSHSIKINGLQRCLPGFNSIRRPIFFLSSRRLQHTAPLRASSAVSQ